MNHPFALDLSDLELINLNFEEQLTDSEAAKVGGGGTLTTLAIGEEGGGGITTYVVGEEGGAEPYPVDLTTLAIGEEGGGVITKALCEDGGCATTLAIGEEGGGELLY